ncbi:FMN-binding protein [Crateriforma spongiae]|uniref:FMN-binding protein n=1 Tax=Crateriforma spongiae TaxID=2724528 RepID=UPI001447442C|nr:FMN-binding protein [Crateriforma spongiae]
MRRNAMNQAASNGKRMVGAHWIRVGIVAVLAWLIPSPNPMLTTEQIGPPTIGQLPVDLPWDVATIEPKPGAAGFWSIADSEGEALGYVARTMPDAQDVVGYRGPSEAVVVIDSQRRIVSVGLLESADTVEHVQVVRNSDDFFAQFQGWTWGEIDRRKKVDAVSGATLTSLALAQGLIQRMGGEAGSLVFADPLNIDDVRDWFPDARRLTGGPATLDVIDAEGDRIGTVVRTGPLVDDVIGYQGPSEWLVRMSDGDVVEDLKLLTTFDNEPYVDWIRQEKYYWKRFTDMTASQLGQLDLEAESIEGISGATMSSIAMTQTLVDAMARYGDAEPDVAEATDPSVWHSIRFSNSDAWMIGLLLAMGLLHQFGGFRNRSLRRTWLIAVFVIVGLYAGNLLSLALLAGWSAEGIAWRLAPGLTAIAAVALLFPPVNKSNPYCNHLCPHGAIQQWVRPGSKSRRRVSVRRGVDVWLRRIPGGLLTIAYVVLLFRPRVDLSGWEPFHAYLFRIAGLGSIVFALATLAVATVIPMAYCRYGCPTGYLIDYVRRAGDGRKLAVADLVLLGLLVLAIARHWVTG